MIKAIIFDFDGVIVESADIKTNAFELLFKDEYPEHVQEIVHYHMQHMGISRFVKFKYFFENIVHKPYTPAVEKALGERFSHIVVEQILHTPFVPGAIEFLQTHQKQYVLFVASGTEEKELHCIAEKRDVTRYFKEIHGGHRSKSEIVNDILQRYSLTPHEIVFIGDAESDMIAARETGVFFIGRIDREDSPLACCTHTIINLYGLEAMLSQLQ